jgi:hypothetical protein
LPCHCVAVGLRFCLYNIFQGAPFGEEAGCPQCAWRELFFCQAAAAFVRLLSLSIVKKALQTSVDVCLVHPIICYISTPTSPTSTTPTSPAPPTYITYLYMSVFVFVFAFMSVCVCVCVSESCVLCLRVYCEYQTHID